MDTREFRDLLDDRTAPAQSRPVPLDDLKSRIRSARRRRAVVAAGCGVVAVAVGAAITVAGLGGGGGTSVTTGSVKPTAKRTATPQEMRDIVRKVQASQNRLALQSRYWWNRLPERTDVAWPREYYTRLQIRPRGRSLGLYAACDGFEATVNVKILLYGASFPKEVGSGRTTEFNCFKGDLYELTIPASTETIVVTVVAQKLKGRGTPGWPLSRPRTWSFAFYEKGAKVPADTPEDTGRAGLPRRVIGLDDREFDDAIRRLTSQLHEQAGLVAPARPRRPS
jgi:hypothetical protein